MSKAVQVYCDSTYRYSGLTNNYIYFLKEPIKGASIFKLTSAEIPLTFYNVRNVSGAVDNNYILYFSEDNGATTLQATLSAGYYTVTSVLSPLQTALNSATVNAYTYTVSYNTTTQKFTITSTGNFILMYPSWLSVNWLLGFQAQSSSNTTSQVAGASPYLDYYSYFYVRLSVNSRLSYDESGSPNKILKIPINQPQGSIQFFFDPSDNHFEILDDRPITSFTIELLDSDYYPINLQGREWSMTLTFYYE